MIKHKIKCKFCNYEWETKSEKIYITCPNCQKKIKDEVKK